jgi:hypothetical protein
VSRSKEWTRNGKFERLKGAFLTDFVPRDIAKLLAQRGWLTIADVLIAVIEAEEVDARSIEDMDLPTYINRRLKSRRFLTIGSTDELSEERVLVYLPGLGKGAVRAINQARLKFGKPPIPRS